MFSAEVDDIDSKYILDFNNSMARFHTKSSRDTSKKIIKKSIQLYDTKIIFLRS
ncbi:MAG: hypothetical protein ACJAZK_002680 [Psychroserpens sp.]|jgi:hypothetical protein